MNRITLEGCAPEPLISYLKALGILRLIGEQLDTKVRAAWHAGTFVIETNLTRDDITRFFLDQYRPTPIIAPWNGGSSFYPKDKSQRETVDALCAIEAPRFEDYRATILRAREIVKDLNLTESPKDKSKAALLRACRRKLPDAALEWLDAAFVLSGDINEGRTSYPPLLGTGGNDGRLEFTVNFIARLLLVLPEAAKEKERDKRRINSENNLRFALYGEGTASLESAAVGQFHPGGAGGVNLTQGVSGGALVNAWDFVLAIEGALMLASATTRQLGSTGKSSASFPFTVQSSTVGYGTATLGEGVRAEMWLPLWSRFSSKAEIAHIFSEGRARFSSTKRKTNAEKEAVEPLRDARSGLDFARAVSELGVDKGIDAFARYGFIERNGLAYLAAPLGRFEVPTDKNANSHAALLSEIDGWLERLRQATRNTERVPPRLVRARLNIEETIFDLCAANDEGKRKQLLRNTLIALGHAEAELARSTKFCDEHNIKPLDSLSVAWADECAYDKDEYGATEYRIALALASITDAGGVARLRVNLEPVVLEKNQLIWKSDSVRDVWSAGSLENNLAAVLRRRWIDARRDDAMWSEARKQHTKADVQPQDDKKDDSLHAQRAMRAMRYAHLEDVGKFLNREVDERLIEDYLRALMLINWSAKTIKRQWHYVDKDTYLELENRESIQARLQPAYSLLKLLFTAGGKLKRHDEWIPIRHEPGVIPLLQTNNATQIDTAFQRAMQRLVSSGLVPFIRNVDRFISPPRSGVRLAAALLIPIDPTAINYLDEAVLQEPKTDSTNNKNGEN